MSKRIVITGTSRGIGYELAQLFSNAGHHVIALSRKVDAIQDLEKDSIFSISTDLSVPSSIDAAAKIILDKWDRIDILINNAGMQHRGELEEFPADAFERLLQTNVASVFHVGQAVARHMIKRGKGKIINIASVQTALARPGIAPYTATKGAVGNLTKGMATDWAKHGLQCNAIAPGYFDTPLNAALVADPEFSEWLAKRTPSGRWGLGHRGCPVPSGTGQCLVRYPVPSRCGC